MSFQEKGYAIERGLISPANAAFFYQAARKADERGETKLGDKCGATTSAAYNNLAMQQLHRLVLPQVAAITGLKLATTFSYFRIYRKGAELTRHSDREACEVAMSMTLGGDSSDSWPIYLATVDGDIAAHLNPGDAVLYKGAELEHWREPFQGEEQVQVFLFFVDQAGPFADQNKDATYSGHSRNRAPIAADQDL